MPSPNPIKRAVSLLLLSALLLAAGTWLWDTPMVRALAEMFRLSRMPAPLELSVPVQGVPAKRVADTWGASRSNGRTHQGVDIFAARGTPVLSATRGVLARIGESGLGGRHAWVIGPGGERHYYAHLDGWAPGLRRWQVLRAGDPIGFVGTTGNARGTPPHLHYGIYTVNGAQNPQPRLRDADPAR